jgi:hypothetical protein
MKITKRHFGKVAIPSAMARGLLDVLDIETASGLWVKRNGTT